MVGAAEHRAGDERRLVRPGDESIVRPARLGEHLRRVRERRIGSGTKLSSRAPDRVPDENARWEEYELPCMPGDPRRRPCLVSRTTIGSTGRCGPSATARRAAKRSRTSRGSCTSSGSSSAASAARAAPRARSVPGRAAAWIRAGLWRYRFTRSRADGAWWERERVGEYLRPLRPTTRGSASSCRATVGPTHRSPMPRRSAPRG